MGYVSKRGRRPNEYASKSAHSYVVSDSAVQEFLEQCSFPQRAENISLSALEQFVYQPMLNTPIRHVIAIDGGYNEVAVQTGFPSSTICFFQIGALIFSIEDLDDLDRQSFIDPEDMTRLKQIQRLKFTLPIRNVKLKNESRLTDSVRRSLYDFFRMKIDNTELIDTLRWFLFEEYNIPVAKWVLASCPSPTCKQRDIALQRNQMTKDFTFKCSCGQEIFLTDVFRLHEAIDDELGANGILAYVTTTIEQIVLVHLIRLILNTKPNLLHQILFIKDGPLAFFGQTANMQRPMRNLVRYLFAQHNLYLAGFEKSGPFVEHADEISAILDNDGLPVLKDGAVLILDNDYIYKYIIPGKADPDHPYGSTTYYSNKLIFRTLHGNMYVLSLPSSQVLINPTKNDVRNLDVILSNVEKLRCDMYDSALIPVALANKLVSLANHPSSRILQRFAIDTISLANT